MKTKLISALIVISLLFMGCSTIEKIPRAVDLAGSIAGNLLSNGAEYVVNGLQTINESLQNVTLNSTASNESNFQWLPNARMTPGSINLNVTQDNIQDTICVSGYTSTIRPSTSYTNKIKAKQIIEYGYVEGNLSLYEEDHLVPLSIGGNPINENNLWPEVYDGQYGAHTKDKLEIFLYRQVCKYNITLFDAQNCIASNWIECGRRLGVFV